MIPVTIIVFIVKPSLASGVNIVTFSLLSLVNIMLERF